MHVVCHLPGHHTMLQDAHLQDQSRSTAHTLKRNPESRIIGSNKPIYKEGRREASEQASKAGWKEGREERGKAGRKEGRKI